MRGQAQPRPFQQAQQAYPQQNYVQPQQQNFAPAHQGSPETLTELLQLQENGQGLSPGKGARLNPDPCPNCGGQLYYDNFGMKRRGPPPAPHCFNCGYNDLFEQGIESTWQGGA